MLQQLLLFIKINKICRALRTDECPNTEFFLVRIQENTDQKKLLFGYFSRSDIFLNTNECPRKSRSANHRTFLISVVFYRISWIFWVYYVDTIK